MAGDTEKEVLNRQNFHWEKTFANTLEMFGEEPSEPARKAVELFQEEGKNKILELGAGQGRHTLFFARNGFQVYALDYSETGVQTIREKAQAQGLAQTVATMRHDVRQPLPFEAGSFDACYSHMLFCMALTTDELEFVSNEVNRVLKPGGICLYTVRHIDVILTTALVSTEVKICTRSAASSSTFSAEKRWSILLRGTRLLTLQSLRKGHFPENCFV